MRTVRFKEQVGGEWDVFEGDCISFDWNRNFGTLRFRIIQEGIEVGYEVPASNIKYFREVL